MAPRTRNNDKRHRRPHKNEVRFPRREVPVRKSGTVIRPPANYENLILYYLTKLKRLFAAPDHPQPKARENSAEKMRREQLEEMKPKTNSGLEINPNKYTASHSTPKPRGDDNDDSEGMDNEIKEKVYNVVNAAIEYGFANNVLEKKGDCFVFKSKRNPKIANRQQTPGPSVNKESYCSQCNCSNCKNFCSYNNNREFQNVRPLSENNSHRPDGRTHGVINSNLHESKTQHSLALRGRTPRPNLHDDKAIHRNSPRSKSCSLTVNNFKYRVKKPCTCPKCRALEQRRKMQKK